MKLKEQELALNKNITILTREVEDIEKSIADERKKGEDVKNELLVLKFKKSTSTNALL